MDEACFLGTSPSGRNGSGSPGSSVVPCNRSVLHLAPYSPEATATFATAITLMVLFTIVGNILVIIAVLTSRSLRGPQNLFLVSLAAADILVATLIIPFSLANELLGYWYFRSAWCEIYLALDVLFCTSSIVHLCAISLDRYLSVSRAVTYGAQRTPRRIKAAILVVWLISAVISFPPLLSMNKSGGGVGPAAGAGPQCQLNDERWYILYSTVGSFFAPCLIMILVYMRIYQIAKQRTRCPPGEPHKGTAVATAAGADPTPTKGQNGRGRGGEATPPKHGSMPRPPTLAVTPPLSSDLERLPAARTPDSNRLAPPTPSTAPPTPQDPSLSSSLSTSHVAAGKKREKKPERKNDNNNGETSSSDSDTEQGVGGAATPSACHPPVGGVHSPTTAHKYRDMIATATGSKLAVRRSKSSASVPPGSARRKAMLNREKRFTFVLAVVIGVFVLCWFPFFFSYSLQAICPQACTLPPPLFKFFFWIGYCNSCLNPVIYTIFNKDFRRAFKKILCRSTKGTFF